MAATRSRARRPAAAKAAPKAAVAAVEPAVTPDATNPAPVAENEPTGAPEAPAPNAPEATEPVEVKPETQEEPDDKSDTGPLDSVGTIDASASNDAPVEAPSIDGGVTIVLRGTRDGGPGPIAETFIVPDDGSDYDDVITSGDTVTLERGVPKEVEGDHADWLTGHPAYLIEEV